MEENNEIKEVKLTITLKPDSKYPTVEGPIKNEPLVFYMLEYARLSVIQANQPQQPIIKPRGSIVDYLRRNKK